MDIKPCYKKQEAKMTSNIGATSDEKAPSSALKRLVVKMFFNSKGRTSIDCRDVVGRDLLGQDGMLILAVFSLMCKGAPC